MALLPRQLAALALSIAIAGFGAYEAGNLTWIKWSGAVPVCLNAPGFDCTAVLTSPWANLLGQPISLYGFFFYVSVLLLAGYLLIKEDVQLHKILKLFTLFGFAFSFYLVGIMVFAIGAFCSHCLSSAASSTLLFLINWLLWPRKVTQNDT